MQSPDHWPVLRDLASWSSPARTKWRSGVCDVWGALRRGPGGDLRRERRRDHGAAGPADDGAGFGTSAGTWG
ncbi:MAG: hypothetical protein ACLS43_08125 [Evtepia gabavorous]